MQKALIIHILFKRQMQRRHKMNIKKIKKICMVGIFTVSAMSANAQMPVTAPTLEATAWSQLIQMGYTFEQSCREVQNSLTMIQQNYERMQHALQEAMTWDFSNITWESGRDPFTALTNADRTVSSLLENVQRAQNALQSDTVLVNGNRYSLADLAGFGSTNKNMQTFKEDVAGQAESLLRKVAQEWAKTISKADAANLMSHYGLTPESYKICREASTLVDDSYKRTIASVMSSMAYDAEKSRSDEISAVLELMLRGGEITEKEIAQMQGALQGYTIQQLQTMTETLQSYISYSVLADQQEKSKEAMTQEPESQFNFRRDYDSIVW